MHECNRKMFAFLPIQNRIYIPENNNKLTLIRSSAIKRLIELNCLRAKCNQIKYIWHKKLSQIDSIPKSKFAAKRGMRNLCNLDNLIFNGFKSVYVNITSIQIKFIDRTIGGQLIKLNLVS